MSSTPPPQKAHKVLVVDDDPSTLRLLEVVLRDQGIDTIMMCGSLAAQEWVRQVGVEGLDCALVDYRMPQVNGLQLVGWLLEYDSALATVLMTAEGDVELVAGALRQGVVDYVEKPFRRSDLVAALDKAAGITAERRYMMSAAEEVRDINVIHSRLVPRKDVLPAGFARGFTTVFETAFHPAHEAGGDFVNCFPIDADRLLVVAGDVSGHDLKAGFISSYFQGMCRGMIAMNASVAQVREYFNHFLHSEWNRHRRHHDGSDNILTSLSVCFLLFDFSRMSLACLNNGFPVPTLCNGEGEAISVGDGGPPLGWFGNPETQHTDIAMPASGSVVLFSDGLLDQAQPTGDSPYALSDRLFTGPKTLARVLLRNQRDDVLAVRFSWHRDAAAPAPRLLYAGTYPGDATDHVDDYQAQWNSAILLGVPDIDEDMRRDILLCCREAILNAMLHGSARRADRKCRLTICLVNRSLSIRVDDEGIGYDTRRTQPTPQPGEHISMGLRIIQCYATRVTTARSGATLTMDFTIASPIKQ